MRKSVYIIILVFALASSTIAQTRDTVSNENISRNEKVRESRDAKRRVVVGLKAGINNGNVYDEKGQDFVANSKVGFAGGGFMAIPLGSIFGIQPEVLISQKGFSSSGRILNNSYTLERTTTYLDIPLQIQIKPFRFLSIVGGVQYSYLLNQSDRLYFGPNSVDNSADFDNDNIRRNIMGAVGGADINIQHFVISGRVGWDLFANMGDGTSFTPRYKNLWVQATVGFRFY